MLSVPHLIVIFVVALVIFGPEKLPELARNLGKVMAEFRRATGDLRSTFEGHLREIEREGENRRIQGTPSNLPAPAEVVPAPPAPGTVPSDPPNFAALATGASEIAPAEGSGNSETPPSQSGEERQPPATAPESSAENQLLPFAETPSSQHPEHKSPSE